MTQENATEELVINEENFNQYFKDLRQSVPEKGDIIAKYSASAEFVDGNEKRQIISLLLDTENKMEATAQVMRKLLFASEIDAYKVPRMMADDLLSGMSEEECASKPYKYVLEMFFYAKPENVPKEDPHWSVISVLNLQDFLDKTKEDDIQSRILSKEESQEEIKKIENEHNPESGQEEICGNASGNEVPEAQ